MKRNSTKRQRRFMNTEISIETIQVDEYTVDLNDAMESAFWEFQRIVNKFTRFDENSELSNLNRNSGKWVKVSEEFIKLIKFMLEMAKKTDGAFDPTIIDFLEIYGYDKNYNFDRLDNPKLDNMVKELVAKRPNWREIQLDESAQKVMLATNQKIDLGGIGKGYAIDCAYDQLAKVCKNFLIDAGGDVRARGENEKGEKWQVGLKAKAKDSEDIENIGALELFSGEAVASSGSWARKFKQFHHLINPLSGKPVEADYSTVFVKAPSAMEADAWATALFVNCGIITPRFIDYFSY